MKLIKMKELYITTEYYSEYNVFSVSVNTFIANKRNSFNRSLFVQP